MSARIIALSLVLVSLLLASCMTEGELRIRNRSTTDVTVSLDYNSEKTIRPNEDYSRFYTSNKDVEVRYNGLYVFSTYLVKYVEPGTVNTVTITSDGGAIRVINSSNRTISEVYLSPSNSSTWGPDDLEGDIAPGESVSWTVTEGFWDIRIRNNLNQDYEYYSKMVYKDSTYTQNFEGRGEEGSKSKTEDTKQSLTMKSEQFNCQ